MAWEIEEGWHAGHPVDMDNGIVIRLEESFARRGSAAAFLEIEETYTGTRRCAHLTADEAEDMATVLMYLAKKWSTEHE